MNILVDTNIFLDVLLNREGLADESEQILDWCEGHPCDGWIAWHTLANLYYIGAKQTNPEQAILFVDEILAVFETCPVDSATARNARKLHISDFEDALQIAAGQRAEVDLIITRNTRHFRKSPIRAVTPAQFLKSHSTRR